MNHHAKHNLNTSAPFMRKGISFVMFGLGHIQVQHHVPRMDHFRVKNTHLYMYTYLFLKEDFECTICFPVVYISR